MATNATKTTKASANHSSGTQSRQTQAKPEGIDYVRQTAERTVDVPVGAALRVVDRVNELVEPLTSRKAAERELKSLRTQVTREFSRLERRGSSARRKATRQVRTTRNRVERDINKRRRSVETAVKRNRTQVNRRFRGVEDSLKKAQSSVQERVSTLV
jgi:hypothetical protein